MRSQDAKAAMEALRIRGYEVWKELEAFDLGVAGTKIVTPVKENGRVIGNIVIHFEELPQPPAQQLNLFE